MKSKVFNIETLKHLLSARSIRDFDEFLDSLPLNVGYNALLFVGIMWAIAAGTLFFTINQADKAAALRSNIMEVRALKPPVPQVEYKDVDRKKLEEFSEFVKKTFQDINVVTRNGGQVILSAQDTDFFPQFISAISYFQRGARNWKVNIKELCVGRDCKTTKLMALLIVQTVNIGEAEKDGK